MSEIMLVNPRRKKRKSPRRAPRVHARKRRTFKANPKRAKRRAAPRAKARRVRRRKFGGVSRSGIMGIVKSTLLPSTVGAAGAIGTDILLGLLPIPDTIKNGPMRPLVAIGAAVLLGWGVGRFTNRALGDKITMGGVTVVAYNTLKGIVTPMLPAGTMNGLGEDYQALEFMSAGYPAGALNEYVGSGIVQPMGEYVGQQF